MDISGVALAMCPRHYSTWGFINLYKGERYFIFVDFFSCISGPEMGKLAAFFGNGKKDVVLFYDVICRYFFINPYLFNFKLQRVF